MPYSRTALLSLVLSPCVLSAATQPSDQQAQRLKSLTLEQLGNIEVTTQSKEPTEVWNTPAAIYVLTAEMYPPKLAPFRRHEFGEPPSAFVR